MTTTINIQNLKCGGCANTIITKVSAIANVSNVTVNTETDTVEFSYNSEEDIAAVKNKLAAIGYPEVGEKNSLTAKAKSFVSCASGRLNQN
ncbi:MAG: heavy-metal-associated domain-containing protein [Flavobacteriaceae bacterium]